MRASLLRIAGLILLGAVLAPISGYFAGLVLGKEMVIWLVAMLVGIFVSGAKGALTMLALPGVLGASWAWPVTCVIFPLTALFVRGSAQTPFWFAGLGAAAGALTAYAWIATGLKPAEAELWQYLLAGASGGLGAGMIFGYALRRIDTAKRPPVADVKD